MLPQNDADSDVDDALDPEPLGKDKSETSVSSSMSPVAEHSNWEEWDNERLIDSRPDPPNDHSRNPYQEPILVSRQSGSNLNPYFVDGKFIHRQVLQ